MGAVGQSLGPRARWASIVLVLVLAVALVVATASLAQVLRLRADTRAAARATAATELAIVASTADRTEQEAFRAAADGRLAEARHALDAADATLDAATADHAAVLGQLEGVQVQLVALQQAVAGAESEVFANAALVRLLATCLDGLSELVNQLAVGDGDGAVRTVDDIGDACAAVGAAIR